MGAVVAGLAGVFVLLLGFAWSRSGRAFLTVFVSGDPLRSSTCHVWVLTNRDTQEIRYVAHALETGHVPALGEGHFPDIRALSGAIRGGRFGLSPRLAPHFPGDPDGTSPWTVRVPSPEEIAALRDLVPFHVRWEGQR